METDHIKKLYIIRHGETDYNKKGLVQGSGIDSNLNEQGWKQANAFFQYYKHIPFDQIYTSCLKRTHQTVNLFIEKNIGWQQLDGLNEMCWGEKEGRKLTLQDDKAHAEMLKNWQKGILHLKCKGGESPLEVQERQMRAFEVIIERHYEKNVLVCMHGRAMRVLLCWLLEKCLSEMDTFKHQNLSLYEIHYNYQTQKFTLVRENDIVHLQHIHPPHRTYTHAHFFSPTEKQKAVC